MKDDITASCGICGNTSGYDKESLKGSTWKINSCKIVLCISCEDELLKKIADCRGLRINYGDGGEIRSIKVVDKTIKVIK